MNEGKKQYVFLDKIFFVMQKKFLFNEVRPLEESEVLRELSLLRYHQRLIVEMLDRPDKEFYKLVIYYGLTEVEVKEFFDLCESLNMKLEEQKAEGFVYFHPLYRLFLERLNKKLSAKEVIHACISQKLYKPLMAELENYL
jgi:hypothetical protein